MTAITEGTKMAEILYKLIEKAAIENGHTEFKKYAEAEGMIIIVFLKDSTTAFHAIGAIGFKEAFDHLIKMMMVKSQDVQKESLGHAE